MQSEKETQPTSRFCFFLVPGFSLVALSCAIDVLRAANVEIGHEVFSWYLAGSLPLDNERSEIISSSGLGLTVSDLAQNADCDVISVCGGEKSHLFNCERTDNWLRQQARLGKTIGSISDGAYVVAAAGLFDDCRSTIHWKCQFAYRERHPKADIRTSILEIDGTRFSCAGGTASLDLMLHFVMQKTDRETVGKIADNYFHDVVRGQDQAQQMTSAYRFAGRDQVMTDALLLMESNLEVPLQIATISHQLNISPRQLDRLFTKHLGTTPSAHYREIRLIRASGLLKQSQLSISEIAVGCGFQSSSHLGRHFKKMYGRTPMQQRRIV